MMAGRLASPNFALERVMIYKMWRKDAAAFFCDIARTASLASDLGRDQSGAALLALSSQSSVSDDQAGQWRVLRALFDLTHYDPARRGDLVNSGCCLAVEKLSTTANVQARQCAAACLCYLSEHKPSRAKNGLGRRRRRARTSRGRYASERRHEALVCRCISELECRNRSEQGRRRGLVKCDLQR